jgi:hypothetical protein
VGEGEKKLYGTGGEFSFQMGPTYCSIDVLSDALSPAQKKCEGQIRVSRT